MGRELLIIVGGGGELIVMVERYISWAIGQSIERTLARGLPNRYNRTLAHVLQLEQGEEWKQS